MNPLYLLIGHASGYILKKGLNKYLVFNYVDENKELFKKWNVVLNVIKYKIQKVRDSEFDYKKDYMEIKFNSDDNVSLNKPLKFHLMTTTIRCVFEKDRNLYPQFYLDYSLYELNL